MDAFAKMSGFHMSLRDLPRASGFPLRVVGAGFLRDNWHDDLRRDLRACIFGLMLGSRDGSCHWLLDGVERRFQCPVAGFLKPGGSWRNLSPAPWDELYLSYPAGSEAVLAGLGLELGGHRELSMTSALTDALARLRRLLDCPHGPGNADRIDLAAFDVLMECQLAALAPASDDPAERTVLELASWLRLNYRERLDVRGFLRGRGVSYRTFMRRWEERFAVPPTQFTLDLKMEEARRLLRETGLTVAQVAAALRLDDPLYFSRLFRRREGVSPRQYRVRETVDDC